MKKELAELRKQIKPDNGMIHTIQTCYVNGDKQIVAVNRHSFLSLPEEDAHKYCDIFKKCLSGRKGATMFDLQFEKGSEERQRELLLLRESDDALDAFFEEIVSKVTLEGNFLIAAAQGAYDVPKKMTDLTILDDASDEVYQFVICCICPVELSTPGLCYSEQENDIRNSDRIWMVHPPETGFLYPAFTDRMQDVNSCWYYTRKAFHEEIVSDVLSCVTQPESKEQIEQYTGTVETALDRACTMENLKQVGEEISAFLEETESDHLEKEDLGGILERSGAEHTEEALEHFPGIAAVNLPKAIRIESEGIRIRVKAGCEYLISEKVVDGVPSLVIPIEEDMKFNGIPLRFSPEEP